MNTNIKLKDINLNAEQEIVNYVFDNKLEQKTTRGAVLITDKYIAIESGCELDFNGFISTTKKDLLVSGISYIVENKDEVEFNIYKRRKNTDINFNFQIQ